MMEKASSEQTSEAEGRGANERSEFASCEQSEQASEVEGRGGSPPVISGAIMSKDAATAGGARTRTVSARFWTCACVSVSVMALGAVAALIAFLTHQSGGQMHHFTANNCSDWVCVVPRADWGARPPKKTEPLRTPVDTYIVHHSYIPAACHDRQECALAMRAMQDFHMDERGWDDIGYNFAIGGDAVYEGRGWTTHGAHSGPKYNYRSIGIVLIGSYIDKLPSTEMLAMLQALMADGVDNNCVVKNYTLLGHRQVKDTECPGEMLYRLIQKWPHWTPINNVTTSK